LSPQGRSARWWRICNSTGGKRQENLGILWASQAGSARGGAGGGGGPLGGESIAKKGGKLRDEERLRRQVQSKRRKTSISNWVTC